MQTGDYIRTKNYGFIKVKSFYYDEDLIHILDENNNEYDFSKELVNNFKSSPNIIDLIEVGDYVNGSKVIEVNNKDNELYNKYIVIELCYFNNEYVSYSNDNIKSIVTKEQFESMEYKIGDDKE